MGEDEYEDEYEHEDNFYLALKKYVELYGDDDGNVSSEVFTPLNEVVKSIHRFGCTDAINFIEKNKAYKEAYSASLALQRGYNSAYFLQICCLIEGWGCEVNAEDKKKARKMLEDRFEALEAEDCRLNPVNPFRKLGCVQELLYCYKYYVLSGALPPSEVNKMQISTVQEHEHRENRLRELNALLDSMMKANKEEHERYIAQYYAIRDEMRSWREERNNGNQITKV